MKLLSLFLLHYVAADVCLICDYVGFAKDEATALSMLSGVDATGAAVNGAPVCATVSNKDWTVKTGNGANSKDDYSTISDKANCVAQFFIYYAKDIDKYVYGVKRTASDSSVTEGRVDVEGYDGVKGYQYSLARDDTTSAANRIWGRKFKLATNTNDNTDGNVPTESDATYVSYGGNPIFKRRSMYYGVCSATTAAAKDCMASNVDTTTDDPDDVQTFPYVLSGQASLVPASNCAAGTAQCDAVATASGTAGAVGTASCVLVYSTTNTDCTTSAGFTDTADIVLTYMGDGREDAPSTVSADTAISTTTPQEVPYTRCLVCHGSQEFLTPPATSNQITIPCWNPSGSSTFETTDAATMDPRKYCQPANGFCSTVTWQYSTKDKTGTTTSHWVGVERGCSDPSTDQTAPTYTDDGNANYNFKRGLSSTNAFVRYHVATNTASKAKDNAKFPDADVATKLPVALGTSTSAFASAKTALTDTATGGFGDTGAADDLLVALTPQFSSVDGNGKPDIPTTVLENELECISCVTPIGNTDASNNCVTAKASGRVMCKTLNCQAVTATYRLGVEGTDTYYYAKRGCTADPEDGAVEGEQDPADAAVTPEGWTGIKQYNQRSTTAVGNTQRTSTVSVAKIFDCYACESHFTATVSGADPVEPKYDTIKTKDTSLCWETFEPQSDSSVTSTGTSGSCTGNCYASAYKYKESAGTAKNPTTTFHWHIKRNCATDKSSISTGTTPSADIYGVSVTNYVCTFQNGTLCNGQIKAYDTTLEIATQNVRKIQCYECETAAGNADPLDPCYTIVSTAKATECPDLSYTSCFATETAFNTSATTSSLGMKRGCAKGNPGAESAAVEGYTNVMASTTYCTSSSCNKGAGKTAGLVMAEGSAPVAPEGTDDNDTAGAQIVFVSFYMILVSMIAL